MERKRDEISEGPNVPVLLRRALARPRKTLPEPARGSPEMRPLGITCALYASCRGFYPGCLAGVRAKSNVWALGRARTAYRAHLSLSTITLRVSALKASRGNNSFEAGRRAREAPATAARAPKNPE